MINLSKQEANANYSVAVRILMDSHINSMFSLWEGFSYALEKLPFELRSIVNIVIKSKKDSPVYEDISIFFNDKYHPYTSTPSNAFRAYYNSFKEIKSVEQVREDLKAIKDFDKSLKAARAILNRKDNRYSLGDSEIWINYKNIKAKVVLEVLGKKYEVSRSSMV